MGLIAVTIIFICLCTDNLVIANMSGTNMELKTKSVFSIKTALYFAGCNALLFTLGYLFSIVFFRVYFVPAHRWIAFAFLMLLGIKYMLETIEKSPSFKENEVDDKHKMWRVSLLTALQFAMVGYPLELMGKSWFPQVLFLLVITFLMTVLGFHLGVKGSKRILTKYAEFAAGVVLVIMAVRLIVL